MTFDEAPVLARFERERRAWERNPALRTLYAYWYGEIARALGPALEGSVLELGSGPGFAPLFLPGIETSDIVHGTWLDRHVDAAQDWRVEAASLDGAFVLDVLHHLSDPGGFFRESIRCLRPGGRLALMEPFVSWLSYPIYRFLHEEETDLSANPFSLPRAAPGKDPFASNQAIPTLVFGKYLAQFERRFPELRIIERRLYSGLSYVASGGFSHRALLPGGVWDRIFRLDQQMPRAALPRVAFRMLAVLERRG